MTERALARRYIRESREASSLVDTPTSVGAVVAVLEGTLVAGEEREVAGRVWAQSRHVSSPSAISEGDVVVVGDRDDAQRLAIERGVALLVTSNGTTPSDEILELARERGTAVVCSPLDTYVSARMITLAAPCRGLMDADPLTVSPDDLVGDVAERVKDVHYRAAVAVDGAQRPVGLMTRSDLVRPQPRRVLLVDHAEQGQSVPGVEEVEIVEILDHHHIGSIETRVPVRATFDPVGSTATLVAERFRQNGLEPARPTAVLLLGAVLTDTVILGSPTTTERDHTVVEYLERVLELDARSSAERCSRRLRRVRPRSRRHRGERRQGVRGEQRPHDLDRADRDGRQDAARAPGRAARGDRPGARARRLRALALMVTDILGKSTDLLVSGDRAAAERAWGAEASDGVIELPGVISRKKQVAPPLLASL